MVCFQVKLQNKNNCEVRRFSMDNAELSYDALKHKIVDIFPDIQGQELEIFWVDNESDLVKMSSEEELLEAVRVQADNQVLKMLVKTAEQPPQKCQSCASENDSVLFKCSVCADYLLCGDCVGIGIHSEHQETRLEISDEGDRSLPRPIHEVTHNQRGGIRTGPRGGRSNRGGSMFNFQGFIGPRGAMMMTPRGLINQGRGMFNPRGGMATPRGRCRGGIIPAVQRGLPRARMMSPYMSNPRGVLFPQPRGMLGPQGCRPLHPSNRTRRGLGTGPRMADPRQMMADPRQMMDDPRQMMDDPREMMADQREMMADPREMMADPRENMPHDLMSVRDDVLDGMDDPREEMLFHSEAGMVGVEGNTHGGHRIPCA